MVSMNMQMQQAMAAQSDEMNEIQEMMDAMQSKCSGGGYGGRGGRGDGAKDFKPQEDNTASTPGWAQWSNEGGPHFRKRERCNLGAYCWIHGFDPLGFNHTSRNCKDRKEDHEE